MNILLLGDANNFDLIDNFNFSDHIFPNFLRTKFHCKQIILVLWNKFTQNRYLQSKKSRHQVSSSIDNFDFFDQICPKMVFPLKSRTNKHYHRIQNIPISLSTDFHFTQAVLIFWTKFAQKSISG